MATPIKSVTLNAVMRFDLVARYNLRERVTVTSSPSYAKRFGWQARLLLKEKEPAKSYF